MFGLLGKEVEYRIKRDVIKQIIISGILFLLHVVRPLKM